MSNELGFRDRFMLVAGERPYAWGASLNLPKHFITSCLKGNFKPQKKNLTLLVEATGIPESWWLNGEGPPPTGNAHQSPQVAMQPEMANDRSVSRYVRSSVLTDTEGNLLKLNAQTISPSVAFATRVLLVMQRLSWLPEDLDDTVRSKLVVRLFSRLNFDSGANELDLERLIESDGVIESALRYDWELQRVFSTDKTQSLNK